MPRICEVCGRVEEDEGHVNEAASSMEMLSVCAECRNDWEPDYD